MGGLGHHERSRGGRGCGTGMARLECSHEMMFFLVFCMEFGCGMRLRDYLVGNMIRLPVQ